jgi:hypothetical protein
VPLDVLPPVSRRERGVRLAPGVRRLGRSAPAGRDEYVGIPAPDGNTYPLSWRCGAPEVGEFVDAELLHGVLTAQLGQCCRHPA